MRFRQFILWSFGAITLGLITTVFRSAFNSQPMFVEQDFEEIVYGFLRCYFWTRVKILQFELARFASDHRQQESNSYLPNLKFSSLLSAAEEKLLHGWYTLANTFDVQSNTGQGSNMCRSAKVNTSANKQTRYTLYCSEIFKKAKVNFASAALNQISYSKSRLVSVRLGLSKEFLSNGVSSCGLKEWV